MFKCNIEIKAKITDTDFIRQILNEHSAKFIGIDHQEDTYFKVKRGRLKIREGTIEKYLVYYQRKNKKGPKRSDVILVPLSTPLKDTLYKSLDILCAVSKKREIYFIDNIKFHIDDVENFGFFVEIEAMVIPPKNIRDAYKQVKEFRKLFNIKEDDLLSCSYSDLILKCGKQKKTLINHRTNPNQLMLVNINKS